jgi:hypothetical protein
LLVLGPYRIGCHESGEPRPVLGQKRQSLGLEESKKSQEGGKVTRRREAVSLGRASQTSGFCAAAHLTHCGAHISRLPSSVCLPVATASLFSPLLSLDQSSLSRIQTSCLLSELTVLIISPHTHGLGLSI